MSLRQIRNLVFGAAVAFMVSAVALVLVVGTPAAFRHPGVGLLWLLGIACLVVSQVQTLLLRRRARLQAAGLSDERV